MRHFLFLVLFSSIVSAQDINSIKKSRVTFLVHDGIEDVTVLSKNNYLKEYTYNLAPLEVPFEHNRLSFMYMYFRDFDSQAINDSSIVFTVNKSFIKKNKDIILSKENMNTLNRRELIGLLRSRRKFFLIDKSEIKNGKAIIRQVYYIYAGEE